ncbi:hypothetical protein [Paenibacillus humicus]|uniref:hypothetical protein n=1 Tax=Paenibacillus humicus TaxID=412861 RepID=UPI000FD6FDCC|nr:hypothetical protein [Paenibacillus humicus]
MQVLFQGVRTTEGNFAIVFGKGAEGLAFGAQSFSALISGTGALNWADAEGVQIKEETSSEEQRAKKRGRPRSKKAEVIEEELPAYAVEWERLRADITRLVRQLGNRDYKDCERNIRESRAWDDAYEILRQKTGYVVGYPSHVFYKKAKHPSKINTVLKAGRGDDLLKCLEAEMKPAKTSKRSAKKEVMTNV